MFARVLSYGAKAKLLRTIGQRRRVSDRITQKYTLKINSLAAQYHAGKIDLGTWQIEMRELLRRLYTLQLVAGAGNNKNAIDPREYLKLGSMLRTQYAYLERFTTYIETKQPTLGYIQARARMYGASSNQAFWQQVTGVALPAYPGDGSTRCRTACKCQWELKYIRDRTGRVVWIEATWKLGKAEHCEDCVTRAETWKPLRIPIAVGDRVSTAFKSISAARIA